MVELVELMELVEPDWCGVSAMSVSSFDTKVQ